MPGWLQALAKANPLSYVVDLLRGYMIYGHVSGAVTDWAILIGVVVVPQIVAGRYYQAIMQ